MASSASGEGCSAPTGILGARTAASRQCLDQATMATSFKKIGSFVWCPAHVISSSSKRDLSLDCVICRTINVSKLSLESLSSTTSPHTPTPVPIPSRASLAVPCRILPLILPILLPALLLLLLLLLPPPYSNTSIARLLQTSVRDYQCL